MHPPPPPLHWGLGREGREGGREGGGRDGGWEQLRGNSSEERVLPSANVPKKTEALEIVKLSNELFSATTYKLTD